jgi:hypothetical protein
MKVVAASGKSEHRNDNRESKGMTVEGTASHNTEHFQNKKKLFDINNETFFA